MSSTWLIQLVELNITTEKRYVRARCMCTRCLCARCMYDSEVYVCEVYVHELYVWELYLGEVCGWEFYVYIPMKWHKSMTTDRYWRAFVCPCRLIISVFLRRWPAADYGADWPRNAIYTLDRWSRKCGLVTWERFVELRFCGWHY